MTAVLPCPPASKANVTVGGLYTYPAFAAGMLEAERQFRRVNGFRDLHVLVRALECHREVLESGKQVA